MNKTAHQTTTARAQSPLLGVADLRIDPEWLQRMWALNPVERLAAARRGQFTLGEMLRWAARRPREVPLVDGELFFIAALSADSESDDDDDAGRRLGQTHAPPKLAARPIGLL